MEAVAPLANDPIMMGRPIWSFRDLEHQNPLIISDFIDNSRVEHQNETDQMEHDAIS